MTTLFEVARNFLEREPNMSLKKLQKLCWYAYSWFIALNNDPEETNKCELVKLFDNRAEAWVHGPVFKTLYTDYRYRDKFEINNANEIKDKEIISHLDDIWNVYGGYNGNELESLTHQETPWKMARGDLKTSEPSINLIDETYVFEEYLNRD